MDENSLLYWYEKIKGLKIPQPETEIIMLSDEDVNNFWTPDMSEELLNNIYEKTEKMGYPLFIRTDQASDKHNWKDASFIKSKERVAFCIYRTVEHNLCATILGLPFKALVFRKYIPLNSKFTAFYGKMPVASERRYFINNGQIQCHHPYWILDSIDDSSVDNWRELLIELNEESPEEVELLSKYALSVAETLEGYWSVDFALADDGVWYLIDMAKGEDSFHYIECEYCSEEMREYYTKLWEERRW